jgi:hypothetical protein
LRGKFRRNFRAKDVSDGRCFADPALRDELLQACRASGGTVHAVVQAIVDTLMVSIIAVAPNVDAAEADIRNITQCMRENIRKSYAEFHDMAAAQRGTRQ